MSTATKSGKPANGINFIKRPDVTVRDRKLDTLNVQLKKVDQEVALLRKQIDQLQLDDKSSKERKSLQDANKEIIKTQADFKNRRNAIHDDVKQLDAAIKRRATEINDKLGKKHKYTTTGEAKSRIAEIEDLIGSGNLSIVEEKMMVKEMQSLNKLLKDLAAIEPIKKFIDADKAKIAQLKEELSTLNPREISTKFEDNQKKLNNLQSASQSVYDKRQTLFNKRSALYKKRDEIYVQIRQIRSDFDNEFKAFRSKMEKERLRREQDQLLSKLVEEKEAAIGKLEEKLNHAKVPAFTYEISAIENALVVLDPSYEKPKKNVLNEVTDSDMNTAAANERKVDAGDLVLVEKKEVIRTAPSKSKKHKKKSKDQSSTTNGIFGKIDGKFSLEPTLIATLAELDVTVPIAHDDVAKTIEELKSKHEELISKQDEQTEKNVSVVEEQLENLKSKYEEKEEQIKKELEEKRLKEQQAAVENGDEA